MGGAFGLGGTVGDAACNGLDAPARRKKKEKKIKLIRKGAGFIGFSLIGCDVALTTDSF